jgi:hypothetical protein
MSARAQRPPRRIFRFVLFAGLVAAIVLAVMYARCRGGWGLGGGSRSGLGLGSGTTQAPQPALSGGASADAGVPRCQIRVDGGGISVDGKPLTVAGAVATCTRARAADVVVTGDALQGTWDELRLAFERAAIQTFVRGRPESPAPPLDAGRPPAPPK